MPGERVAPPLSPRDAAMYDRHSQLPRALDTIEQTRQTLDNMPGRKFTIGQCVNGEKSQIEIDDQVLKAMQGAAFGMWSEMVSDGLKPVANLLVNQHRAKYGQRTMEPATNGADEATNGSGTNNNL